MYSPIQLAYKYLAYYFSSSNGRGHGIHSPFVFDFITKVLNERKSFDAYKKIENIRGEFLNNHAQLSVMDFGAGSVHGNGRVRKVSEICRNAAKSAKFTRLLYRMAEYYKPEKILELGTSLGISTSALALAVPDADVITMEGSGAVADLAVAGFRASLLTNIFLVRGNFDDTLPGVLNLMGEVDLCFVDGNHRKEPTLRYFKSLLPYMRDGSILIFDDIHWSAEMEAAWKEISDHPDVLLSVDLFYIGIVFFSKDFKVKQHFVINF
ncbi:MAG: class I SAM-dependent methyltransferase [Gemmatimonadaceae bacterium]|nr:class I SAM-dependent methyltransferase [Chitinophagaceae bacterium]